MNDGEPTSIFIGNSMGIIFVMCLVNIVGEVILVIITEVRFLVNVLTACLYE